MQTVTMTTFFPDTALSGKVSLLFPDSAKKFRSIRKNSGRLATVTYTQTQIDIEQLMLCECECVCVEVFADSLSGAPPLTKRLLLLLLLVLVVVVSFPAHIVALSC